MKIYAKAPPVKMWEANYVTESLLLEVAIRDAERFLPKKAEPFSVGKWIQCAHLDGASWTRLECYCDEGKACEMHPDANADLSKTCDSTSADRELETLRRQLAQARADRADLLDTVAQFLRGECTCVRQYQEDVEGLQHFPGCPVVMQRQLAEVTRQRDGLARLLEVSACPSNCIGGAYPGADGEPIQCQFCYERGGALAQLNEEGSSDD